MFDENQNDSDTGVRSIAVILVMAIVVLIFFVIVAHAACDVPGAVNSTITQDNIRNTICKSGWTKTIRPPVEYTNGLKRKLLGNNYSIANMKLYELDHCVPLELGGAPRDPQNLWLQPWNGACGAHDKDKIENQLREQVCAGKITLVTAQAKVMQWCQEAKP